jgi:3-isopropylmalate/(R)-2-methylmalate dehydratase small subunit
MAENGNNSSNGPRFIRQRGIAAPLLMDNVDTDIISPIGKPPIPGVPKEKRAFEPIRFFSDGREKSDFILNQEAFRNASIILAGKNFGTGSSRSVAVTRPMDGGITVVIAESFGPLFYDNSIRYGLLAVPLAGEIIEMLAQWSYDHPGQEILVDLEREIIQVPGMENIEFRIEPRVRRKLLSGYTPLEELQEIEEQITEFSDGYERSRPWVFQANHQGR